MNKLRVGVIGCGHWGKNYARVFAELKETTVSACCDQIPKNVDAMKERHPSIRTTGDFRDIVGDPAIDVVAIATPAASHHEIASAALENGKHVVVEKPFALTVGDCERLIALSEAKRRTLMVGHTFLYNDSVRKMGDLIRSGSVGEVYYLNSRRNHLGMIREDVCAVWDLAPHDVAIFSWLIGSFPKTVSAVGGSYLKDGRPDVAFITLFYDKGIMGNIQVSWVDSNKVREVVIIGSKRRIVFDDLNPMESVRIYEKGISFDQDVDSFGEFQYLLRDGDILSPKINHREPLKVQCQHFVECVTQGKKPLTDGQNGLDVVKVLLAISESIDKKGAAIEVG